MLSLVKLAVVEALVAVVAADDFCEYLIGSLLSLK